MEKAKVASDSGGTKEARVESGNAEN